MHTTSGWVYVVFIVHVHSQRIVGWHAQTSRGMELVRIPLRLALWEHDWTQHPVVAGELTQQSTPKNTRLVHPCRSLRAPATLTQTTRCCHDRLNSPHIPR